MNYQLMAEDVIAVIRRLNLSKVILIGHSMGKTAMKITALCPELVEKLIVIDMSPCLMRDLVIKMFLMAYLR